MRARAPDMGKSRIALADPGCPDGSPYVHGKIQHFWHFGRQFLDSVGFGASDLT